MRKFMWGFLAFHVYTILGGAFVRATSSGAGCGTHWPLCKGQVLPVIGTVHTLIEFIHRISSGIIVVGTLFFVFYVFYHYGKGHFLRRCAKFLIFFVVLEALLGAALVLFGWVGQNASVARGIVVPLHLLNTMFLIATLTVSALSLESLENPQRRKNFQLCFQIPQNKKLFFYSLILCVSVLFIGMTGALTALADTLYPPHAIGYEAFTAAATHTSFLKTMRVFHPFIAGLLALASVHFAWKIYFESPKNTMKKGQFFIFTGLVFAQLAIGFLNIILFVPIGVQLLHLLFANLVWIFAVKMFFNLNFIQLQIDSKAKNP